MEVRTEVCSQGGGQSLGNPTRDSVVLTLGLTASMSRYPTSEGFGKEPLAEF